MKKIFFLFILLFSFFMFISCTNGNKNIKKVYFTEYDIYTTDSIRTHLTVYVGKINGKDIEYHIFDGKFKCQMEIIINDTDSLAKQHADTLNEAK